MCSYVLACVCTLRHPAICLRTQSNNFPVNYASCVACVLTHSIKLDAMRTACIDRYDASHWIVNMKNTNAQTNERKPHRCIWTSVASNSLQPTERRPREFVRSLRCRPPSEMCVWGGRSSFWHRKRAESEMLLGTVVCICPPEPSGADSDVAIHQ